MTRAASESGEKRCPWHDTNIENYGKSGKNGRLGAVIGEVRGLKNEMSKIKAEQTKMKIRMAVITGGGSIVGSGLVAIVAKLLS